MSFKKKKELRTDETKNSVTRKYEQKAGPDM
jgi:hypothetical protein